MRLLLALLVGVSGLAGAADGVTTIVRSSSDGACIASSSAWANASAEANRSSGRFANAFSTTWSSTAEISPGRQCSDGGTGVAFRIASMIVSALAPSNGWRPVSIWYSSTPVDQMSARSSISPPNNCSGAM